MRRISYGKFKSKKTKKQTNAQASNDKSYDFNEAQEEYFKKGCEITKSYQSNVMYEDYSPQKKKRKYTKRNQNIQELDKEKIDSESSEKSEIHLVIDKNQKISVCSTEVDILQDVVSSENIRLTRSKSSRKIPSYTYNFVFYVAKLYSLAAFTIS
jgi:hypothetical protein